MERPQRMQCPSCQAENEPGAQVCFTCRTVLSVVTQGSVIASRYEILSPLGRGGMGAVYKARDRVLDEIVAVKILRADIAGTPEMAERFRSEIKLARKVSHFNVCRIHEYGEDGRLQFISMELVVGTTLKELLRRRGPLPAGEAFDVAIQAAEGLEAIHRVGIVHRDLKALNIMVDEGGAVRLMDFGIAKRMASENPTDPRDSGYVMGTPEYMSPEQARGRKIDFRSDVYSLGIVVYELFTGRVPFRGDSPVATLLMHVETPPTLEGPEATLFPASLVPILRQALAKEPEERYATARDLAAALRVGRHAALGAPAPLPAAPTGTAPVRVGLRPRARGAALAAGVAVALAALALTLWPRLSRRPTPTPAAAVPSPLLVVTPAPSPAPATPLTAAPVLPSDRSTSSPTPHGRRVEPARQTPAPTPPVAASPPPQDALATTSPTPTDSPAATPTLGPPATPEVGWLLVVVSPWADVTVDGNRIGQTPLGRLALGPGRHDVLLVHPGYEPFRRKVTIRPGETLRLGVDLEFEGVARKR